MVLQLQALWCSKGWFLILRLFLLCDFHFVEWKNETDINQLIELLYLMIIYDFYTVYYLSCGVIYNINNFASIKIYQKLLGYQGDSHFSEDHAWYEIWDVMYEENNKYHLQV